MPIRLVIVGLLFGIGYSVAIVALARIRVVVPERRVGLFVAHQLGMAAIVAGWLLLDRPLGALINGAWLCSAAVWWWLWRRR